MSRPAVPAAGTTITVVSVPAYTRVPCTVIAGVTGNRPAPALPRDFEDLYPDDNWFEAITEDGKKYICPVSGEGWAWARSGGKEISEMLLAAYALHPNSIQMNPVVNPLP